MPLSETAVTLARYLAGKDRERRGCEDDAIRADLGLTPEAYEAAIDELVDYGLVGPALAGAGETYGCVVLTEEGLRAAERGFAPDSLPLTPASLARNPIVATGWAVEQVAGGQELPDGRDALAAEILRAVQGILPIAGECLPPEAMESVQAAAEALIAEVRQPAPRVQVIRRALRVIGFPDGATTFNSPFVAALPPLAAALDALLG